MINMKGVFPDKLSLLVTSCASLGILPDLLTYMFIKSQAEDWSHGRRFRILCGVQCSWLDLSSTSALNYWWASVSILLSWARCNWNHFYTRLVLVRNLWWLTWPVRGDSPGLFKVPSSAASLAAGDVVGAASSQAIFSEGTTVGLKVPFVTE